MKNIVLALMLLAIVGCAGKPKGNSQSQGSKDQDQVVAPPSEQDQILVTEVGQEDKFNQVVVDSGLTLFSKSSTLTLATRRVVTLILHDFTFANCSDASLPPTIHFSVNEHDLERSQTLEAGEHLFLTEINNPEACRNIVATFVVSAGGFGRN